VQNTLSSIVVATSHFFDFDICLEAEMSQRLLLSYSLPCFIFPELKNINNNIQEFVLYLFHHHVHSADYISHKSYFF